MNTRSLYRRVSAVLESIIYVSYMNARRAVLSLFAKGLIKTMENRIFIDAKVYRPYFWVHSLFVFSKIFMLIHVHVSLGITNHNVSTKTVHGRSWNWTTSLILVSQMIKWRNETFFLICSTT